MWFLRAEFQMQSQTVVSIEHPRMISKLPVSSSHQAPAPAVSAEPAAVPVAAPAAVPAAEPAKEAPKAESLPV